MSSQDLVHPDAVIEAGVTIGPGTRVWARTHVRTGARIGSDCIVGENVFIDTGVVVGDRCKIQNNCLLYHGLTVADEVFIGPAVCITNDRNPRAANPDGGRKSEEDWTVSPVRIGRGASLGAQSVVVAGCDIGEHALVGAGSVVTRSVPAHRLVAGNPARPLGWVCRCGHRLEPDLRCPACGRAYREGTAGLTEV